MDEIVIRNETPADYLAVEELTKKAFWNVYGPGCNEHYLVHILREHEDFVPALDLVAEVDGKIIASVIYVKAKLIDEKGGEKEILSFGPLSVLPGYQRKGYGKRLLAYSFEKARELGYDAVVIFGNPENYICSGFVSGKKFGVSTGNDVYPTALLAKELVPGAFGDHKWTYLESPAYQIDEKEAEAFDQSFEPMEKGYRPSQELFYIYSRSRVEG